MRTTAPFRGPDGSPLRNSIAEVHPLRLGGVEQWVMIRGENEHNPPLILLHGGPGLSETGFFRRFNEPLEEMFTVVYWDQRGAGRSFDRKLPRSSMNVERFVADLDELVDWVRRRVGAEKVVLFGHSWGSALGVLYASRFPEKVAAYVGSAQIGDWAAGEAASYAFALEEAERRGDDKALAKLHAMGPPPWDAKTLLEERALVSRLDRSAARNVWDMLRVVAGRRDFSLFDLPRTYRGFRFTLDAMWSEVSRLDLLRAAPALKMPAFFFVGRKDHWVPPEATLAYFAALDAPSKKLVWFDHSGHEPFVDEPTKFHTVMREVVRPAVPANADARAA